MGDQNADHYQMHKDDPEEWNEPQPAPRSTRSSSRRLAAMISVRFTPEEEEVVRLAASDAGQSVSNFVRQAALRAAGSPGPNAVVVPMSTLSMNSTTSFGGATETLRGTTLVQISGSSLTPEETLGR
jgi:hypothetical protein